MKGGIANTTPIEAHPTTKASIADSDASIMQVSNDWRVTG
jgi:hypothetical protein